MDISHPNTNSPSRHAGEGGACLCSVSVVVLLLLSVRDRPNGLSFGFRPKEAASEAPNHFGPKPKLNEREILAERVCLSKE